LDKIILGKNIPGKKDFLGRIIPIWLFLEKPPAGCEFWV
jgi:hypothetical protein